MRLFIKPAWLVVVEYCVEGYAHNEKREHPDAKSEDGDEERPQAFCEFIHTFFAFWG